MPGLKKKRSVAANRHKQKSPKPLPRLRATPKLEDNAMTELNLINSQDDVNSRTCPDCGGDGYIESFTDEWSMSIGHHTVDRSYKCETCCGAGEIEI